MACPAGAGSKSALKVKVQDGPELYVCRLSEGRQDFANLDLVLDEYTEFTVEGAALHITGALRLHDACMSQCRHFGKQLSQIHPVNGCWEHLIGCCDHKSLQGTSYFPLSTAH